MAPPLKANPSPSALRSRAYRKRHPSRIQARNRRDNLKRQYGMEVDDYDQMHAEQDGKCKICGDVQRLKDGTPTGKWLCVDHCHDCMVCRGLLCHFCNTGIGWFEEDLDRMRAALAYVEAHQNDCEARDEAEAVA